MRLAQIMVCQWLGTVIEIETDLSKQELKAVHRTHMVDAEQSGRKLAAHNIIQRVPNIKWQRPGESGCRSPALPFPTLLVAAPHHTNDLIEKENCVPNA